MTQTAYRGYATIGAASRKGWVPMPPGEPAGLDLLAGQAVDQFFLLTGARVTFDACLSAAGRELKRRAAL